MVSAARKAPPPPRRRPAGIPSPLTPREEEVYYSLLINPTLRDVAKELRISVNTLKTHMKRVFRKKCVNSHVELIQSALIEVGCECLSPPPSPRANTKKSA